MENFYLIDSPKINELNKAEKYLLEKQLSIYHTHSSSVIDKVKAINALAKSIGKLQFEYRAWLYDFINYQLKAVKTKEENEVLKSILGCSYLVFGVKSHLEGNSKNAFFNYKQTIKIQEKINKPNSKRCLYKAYNNISLLYEKNGDLSNAIKYYEKCVKLGREIGDKTSLARVFNNLNNILKDRGNFSKSSIYLYKALSIYEENNDEKGIAMTYHNIGNSLQSQLEFDEALKYYLASLKLSESIGDHPKQIYNCVEIGTIYQQKGENDTALKYYMKAVNLPQTSHLPNYAHLRIGSLYEGQNKIDLAMDYYNQSLQLSESMEHKALLSETLSKIGVLEIKCENVEKATLQIKRAFKLAQELSYPGPLKEAATAKVILALYVEDYKLAYEMEKLRNEMQQKILNKDNAKAVIKHQLKYEYEKQLNQRDIDIKEERLNNQHLQEQINILLAKNKLLISKNKMITEKMAEKR